MRNGVPGGKLAMASSRLGQSGKPKRIQLLNSELLLKK